MHNGPSTRTPQEQLERLVVEAGIPPESFLARVADRVAALPDPDRALTNMLRYLEAGFAGPVLRDFAAHDVLLDVFLQLVDQSQYAADILVRSPELLRWLTTTGELRRTKSARQYREEAASATAAFQHPNRKKDALRRFHRREILRIGAADILGEANVDDVVAQLSGLADASAGAALGIAEAEISAQYGPLPPTGLAILGLGKLGGGELNFSSDIDLMFVYEEDAPLDTPLGRMRTVHELAVRLAEQTVKALSEYTHEGHLYRVDMRLRPDGRSGPLAMSRAACRSYYEARGEAWERQMLIKARTIAGDETTGARFLEDLRPFVYPRSSATTPWEAIGVMKDAIEQKLPSDQNIKLGAGGIRDVEFLVQGLQLLYGGRDVTLRCAGTLDALGRLTSAAKIPTDVAAQLGEAYRLYRRVEHRLQLLHGLQRHDMPVEEDERRRLALRLGFPDLRPFDQAVASSRSFVRGQFREMIAGRSLETEKGRGAATGPDFGLRRWVGDDAIGPVVNELLESGRAEAGAERLAALMDIPSVAPLLRQAIRSPGLRRVFLRSVTFSSLLYERFAADPLLVESVFGQARRLLTTRAPGWPDLVSTDPARFRSFNEVRSAMRLLSGRVDIAAIERELTAAADAVMGQLLPSSGSERGFVLLAMGKLGSGEMGFHSDLDLVAVFDGRHMSSDRAQELAHELVRRLSGPPRVYAADFRLRPEGRNAPLAVEAGFFREYLRSRAELWEMLALRRARVTAGDQQVGRHVMRIVRGARPAPDVRVGSYVVRMRAAMEQERVRAGTVNIKVGPGGLADIEFLVQCHQLTDKSRSRANIHAGIPALGRDLLRSRDTDFLLSAAIELRTVEAVLRLNGSTATSELRQGTPPAEAAAAFFALKDDEALRARVENTMSRVRAIFGGACRKLDRSV